MARDMRKDVVILGAGTAGLTAQRTAEKEGASTLIIHSGFLGTTCARYGCMPSKLLIEASKAAEAVRNAHKFGISTTVRIDSGKVMSRVRKLRNYFTSFAQESAEDLKQRKKLITGHAGFEAPGVLRVDGSIRVRYRSVVIATGADPFIPDAYRPFRERLITYKELFELKELPKKILIVGAGVTGLEMAQALAQLGVKVTVIGLRNNIKPLTDPKVLRTALEYFQRTLDFHPDHRLELISRRRDGIEVHFESRKKMHKKIFDRILIAAGRHPNLSSLNLQNAGIEVKRDQSVDCNPGTLQVKGGAVFLAGDVSRIRPVLHEAGDEGVIAGYNAAHYPKIRRFKRKTPMSIAFTQPQIAVAGQTWGRLNPEACSGEADYTDQGRSRIAGVNTGLMRLYADRKSKRILGAELFGPDAEHIAHLLTWCIQKRFTADQMLEFPYYHPTVEESIRTALKNLQFT